MAIYKPSNCAPFLGAVDLTLPDENGQSQEELKISFEVNCSNITPVTAYKIKVLDNNNEIIFEGDEFTSTGTQWLSGTEQQVTLIKKISSSSEKSNHNVIYYLSKDKEYVDYNNNPIKNFKNGGTNQPYKWIITLAQGDNIPPDVSSDKWWDISVAQGKILGSTPKRIQGKYSENILTDYFVQLYTDDDGSVKEYTTGDTKRSLPRARISSYDYSFGYIYPQEGQFLQTDIDSAKTFKIFRNPTDSQYVDTNRKVDLIYKEDINSIQIDGNSPIDKFQIDTSSNSAGSANSAGIYAITYNGDVGEKVLLKYQNTFGSDFAAEATSVLFTNNSVDTEPTNTGEGFSSVPCNGVFQYVSSTLKDGKTVVKWQRTAAFKNISSYIDRDIYVLANGLNYSNGATSGDVLGSTNLQFSDEKAIELYPDESEEYKKYLGEVYKNSTGLTYIRPSNNISKDMRFSYYDNNGALQNILINSYDPEKYCITHNDSTGPLTPYSDSDGIKNTYTISSFFKVSDENPFYAYANPTITIKNQATNDVISQTYSDSTSANSINQRYITFIADFNQENNKSWRNFQYELMDITTGNGQISEKKYSGEIKDTFYGLQNEHYYGVTLTIEDEFGNVSICEGYFFVKVDFVPSAFPFDATYDCLTHSVILNFINDGVVVPKPNLIDQTLKTSNNKTFISIKTGDDGNPIIIWSENSESGIPTLESCKKNKYIYKYLNSNGQVVCGQFDNDSGQELLNTIIQKDASGLICAGAIFQTRNKFYGEGNFPWVISYQQVSNNQYQMILGNFNSDYDIDSSNYKALMEYNSLNNGANLPSSENGNITFRSVHQIGTEFFEGNIVEYYIDTENYNNVSSRLKISVGIPSVSYNGENVYASIYDSSVEKKDYYANPERNGIYLEIIRQIKNNVVEDKWENIEQSIVKKWFDIYEYNKEKSKWLRTTYDNGDGRYWQAKLPVVSPWINADWAPNLSKTNYDYIDTEYFYEKKGEESSLTGYKNLRGDGVLNAGSIDGSQSAQNLTIPTPFQSENKSGQNETVWYDKKAIGMSQVNSSVINVESIEDVIWDDGNYYWQDKPLTMITPFYKQVNINEINSTKNYTGRENIVNRKFLFNIALKGYDDKKKQLTMISEENITAQCYMIKEE